MSIQVLSSRPGASSVFAQNQQSNQDVYIDVYFALGFDSKMLKWKCQLKRWSSVAKVSTVIILPRRFCKRCLSLKLNTCL